MNDINLQEIREFFKRDTYAVLTGLEIESVTPDEVRVSMKITGAHYNAAGGVQGGAIFTLADLAFAVHSNLPAVLGEDVGVVVGQSCSVSYLKGTRGAVLYAKTKLLHRGKSVCVIQVSITDDLGVSIAEVLCNGSVTAKKASGLR
ncbi:MAG: PaaI family thioesterase [Oscillospiraceae bacterium]|jgi:acyl-CoA thioesterase|nr:PaaI family thioesterase [Oscillospiraceae bacterium]